MPQTIWLWVILPKQKDLACRDETRHFIESCGNLKKDRCPITHAGHDNEGKGIGLYLPYTPPYKGEGDR
jgi:hypothetical protein